MQDTQSKFAQSQVLENLPFDPLAILIGLRQRIGWILCWVLLSLAVGITVAFVMGKRSWESYCVLLYQPPTVELSGRIYEPPVVQTQLNLVKLRPNLEATRSKLQLPVSLNLLAAACDITNPRDTQMLIVKCDWDEPTQSATIANTLASVFIESQTKVRNDKLKDALANLVNRRQVLDNKIRDYQSHQDDSVKDEDDLYREITSYQSRLDAIDLMYEKALSDRKALQLKVDRVAAQIDEVKTKIASEEKESAAMEGLSNLNIRIERVREAIADQRRAQVNEVAFEHAERKWKRYKSLYDQNSVSKEEYDSALAEYQMVQSQAKDSDEIKIWKQELDSLYSRVRPSNKKDTASAPILRDLLVHEFDLDLELKGIQEVIARTEESRSRKLNELEKLLDARRSHKARGWQIDAWQDELGEIEKADAIVSSLVNTEASDFQIVSPAAVSPFPSSSNRRLIAVGITGGLSVIGVAFFLALELLQSRVRTAKELSKFVDQPVIGVLVRESDGAAKEADSSMNMEQMRSISNAIVQQEGNSCVLVAGCRQNDGSSSVTRQIARCLGRQNRKVTIVTGHCRTTPSSNHAGDDIPTSRAGLSELLSNLDLNPRQLLSQLDQTNVSILPAGRTPFHPELLGSSRMGEIMASLRDRNEIVLIDGPPLCDYCDAEFLANHVDAVLLVVNSAKCKRSDLNQAIHRIGKIGKRLVGSVLNQGDPRWVGKTGFV